MLQELLCFSGLKRNTYRSLTHTIESGRTGCLFRGTVSVSLSKVVESIRPGSLLV